MTRSRVVGDWRIRAAGTLLVMLMAVGGTGVARAAQSAVAATLTGPGSLAAGGAHACALAAGGTVKCWGLDNAGQLGDGGPTDDFVMKTKPVKVVGISGATAVAAGSDHSCALLKAGTVKCWGLNDAGQLGNNTRTNSSKPVTVKGVHGGGVLSGVIALSAAQSHTCALLAAGAGTVKCWGRNNSGVLGNGSGTRLQALTPESVTGLTRVTAISTSISDTCALLKGGTLQCWGFNEYGELGPGTTYGPDSCDSGEFSFGCSTKPMVVKGISNVVAVSVRPHSTCAVVKNTKVICWGENISPHSVEAKGFVTVAGLSGATAISSPGDLHSVGGGEYSCTLLAGHTVKCWGFNAQGQLGNGTTKNATVPTNVTGLSGVALVSAGADFACVRLASGTAQCWGDNGYGQLGNGGGPSRTKPVKVVGL